jgi:hypothetical protein
LPQPWEQEELEEGQKLYQDIQSISPAKDSTSEGKTTLYLHRRVAKHFPGFRIHYLFGNVGEFLKNQRKGSGSWTIRFDDGSEERWIEEEVNRGLQIRRFQSPSANYDLLQIHNVDEEYLIHAHWTALLDRKKVTENVAEFYLFVLERQRCWERRRLSPFSDQNSRTNSTILRSYHFCNIYRELDRGTCFFHSQMLLLWENDKSTCFEKWAEKVLWASYCYRLVNRIESFTACLDIGGSVKVKRFEKIPELNEWPDFRRLVRRAQDRAQGRRVSNFFGGAFVSAGFEKYIKWLNDVYKHPQLLTNVLENSTSLKSCCKAISKYLPGCGDRTSWQIACDLLESRCLPRCSTNDYCELGKEAQGMHLHKI